jgi:O-antigen ligase
MEMAYRVIAAHPIAGVGPGAYDQTYKSYLTPELAERWQWTVHNYYLLRTAETGIPGGLAFVALLVLALRQALRLMDSANRLLQPIALGWSAGIIALCFQLYWDMWTQFTPQAFLWFMLGTMAAAERIERSEPLQRVSA